MAEEEEDDTDAVVCANVDCRVADTGRCVDGFELNACPHYGREPEHGDEAKAVDNEDTSRDSGVGLRAANALTPSEASGVLRAGETRVIAILGPSAAGKTSLIASLYDLFQDGPVQGIEFSRSRTLHAFEQTCHDARAVSRRIEPHMTRTRRGEVRFYHLEIGGGAAGDGLSLVLGDRAGEEYLEAADDASVATSLMEVVRADSLTVLVDGERMLDSGGRHNVRSEILMMLQALRDGAGLRTGSRLALVLTKLDMVRRSPHVDRVERDFAGLLGDLRRLFGDILTGIEPFWVAASPKLVTGRPEFDVPKRGTGVPELLASWIGPTAPTEHAARPVPAFQRAFARLTPLGEPPG